MLSECVMRRIVLLAAVLVVLAPLGTLLAAEPVKLVVFDMELQDGSHEGERDGIRADQEQRLKVVSDELRNLFRADPRYHLVDIAPARDRIEQVGPILTCNGCERRIAEELGGDFSLFGFVYKVSNLILEIHMFVRNAKTGELVARSSGSIRGNNDESWLHGVRWMYRNRLKPLELGGAAGAAKQ